VNFKRILGGKTAQQYGFGFEEIFRKRALSEGICPVRIPDSCKQISHTKFIRVKSPFDFVIAKNGKSAFIDCKTYKTSRLTYSDIDKHQLENLLSLGQHSAAGYVVWFRNEDQVVFFSWSIMSDLKPKNSLQALDGLVLGDIGNFYLSEIFATFSVKNGNCRTKSN
jgi:penicillin-binding protein-related factor A (putative recombinase)